MQRDQQIFELIEAEKERQLIGLELIASENFVSDDVMAAMGSILTNVLHKKNNPSIGLLSNGSESMKGSEVVKKSAELFRNSHLNFHGNVEGDDIFKGTTDVVVCDGFTGNISLKTTEGLAQMMANFLTLEFKRNFLTKISSLPIFYN